MRKNLILSFSCLLPLLASPPALATEPPRTPDPALALTYFREAEALSHRDSQKLWGLTLYGPMLFVDPATRGVVANQADSQGHLTPVEGVFVGRLPEEINVANTAMDWAGCKWTMLLWPLPEDEITRASLLMHESFHRVQDQLGLPATNPDNDHLDTLEGRLWLQLEWRGLRAALEDPGRRTTALEDALVFRAWRRTLFSDAAVSEAALEMNEGLAEYTGLRVSASSPQTFLEAVIERLEQAPSQRSYVRSFAYASGPAYGLLLDERAGTWRDRLDPETDLGELLRERLDINSPEILQGSAEQRAVRHGGDELRKTEIARDAARRERLAAYRELFVDGPVLVLPMAGETNFSFNPNELVPLEGHGTIYPTLRVTDAWGILDVSDGALMSFETGQIQVAAPGAVAAQPLAGPGWTLELEEGWTVTPGPRPGDYRLAQDDP